MGIEDLFPKKWYEVKTICNNCKQKQTTRIKKGNKAEDVLGNGKCINCGCSELKLEEKNDV